MATAIGDLVIRLGAQTRDFDKKFGRSRGMISSMASRVGALGGKLLGLGAALAGVAGVGGMGLMIRGQFKAIDATAKLSDQLGVSTEKLEGLRHAAELTGAGAKAIDAGLATMAKRLGEAARGSGAATAALEEMGLSAERLAAMSPDEAFYEIAAALEQIEEPPGATR